MELKDILDKIDKKFKGKAVGSSGKCQYLTEDGRKCIIGLFIPDGHPAQESNLGVYDLLLEYKDLAPFMPSNSKTVLTELQWVHDNLDEQLSVKEQKEILKTKVKEKICTT